MTTYMYSTVLSSLIYIEQTEQHHDKRVFVHLQTTCLDQFHLCSVLLVSLQRYMEPEESVLQKSDLIRLLTDSSFHSLHMSEALLC